MYNSKETEALYNFPGYFIASSLLTGTAQLDNR